MAPFPNAHEKKEHEKKENTDRENRGLIIPDVIFNPGDPKGLYHALEIPRDASSDDVRRSYRQKAMLYHPDKNDNPGSTAHFQLIVEAYTVLSDEEMRAAYDRGDDFNFQSGDGVRFEDILSQIFRSAMANPLFDLDESLRNSGFVFASDSSEDDDSSDDLDMPRFIGHAAPKRQGQRRRRGGRNRFIGQRGTQQRAQHSKQSNNETEYEGLNERPNAVSEGRVNEVPRDSAPGLPESQRVESRRGRHRRPIQSNRQHQKGRRGCQSEAEPAPSTSDVVQPGRETREEFIARMISEAPAWLEGRNRLSREKEYETEEF